MSISDIILISLVSIIAVPTVLVILGMFVYVAWFQFLERLRGYR